MRIIYITISYFAILLHSSSSYALDNEKFFEVFSNDIAIAQQNGQRFKDVSTIYKKYKIQNAPLYIRYAFFDSFTDYKVTKAIIDNYESDTGKCNYTYQHDTVLVQLSNSKHIADSINRLIGAQRECKLLSSSELMTNLSRLSHAGIVNSNTRASVNKVLMDIENNNDLFVFNSYATSNFYFTLAAINMKVCLEQSLGNCEQYEAFYPNLVKATERLEESKDYFLHVLQRDYIKDTVAQYAATYNVTNPFE